MANWWKNRINLNNVLSGWLRTLKINRLNVERAGF